MSTLLRHEDLGDGLLLLELCGPRGNALGRPLLGALCTALDSLPANLHGLLLGARGSFFCPGLDLHELLDEDRAAITQAMRLFLRALLRLYALEVPVVAALHGHALAGGCILALTADWRVLARDARIGLNELRAGVPLPWGVTQLLRATIAPVHQTRVCLEGRNAEGDEAVALGLVHETVEPTVIRGRAEQRLRELGRVALQSYGMTKRWLRGPTIDSIAAREEVLLPQFVEAWFGDETQRRLHALRRQLARS